MRQLYGIAPLVLASLLGGQAPGLVLVQNPAPADQSSGQAVTSRVLAQAQAESALADVAHLYEEVNRRYDQGRYEDALELAQQALRRLEQVLPSEDPNISRGFEQVAFLLTMLDRHDEATTYYNLARLMRTAGRGVPVTPDEVSRLPQTFADSVIGQLDARSLRADQSGYLELSDPRFSNSPLSEFRGLPQTGGYLNIHQFEGVAGQTLTMAVTSDEIEDLLILVFSADGGFLGMGSGAATQMTLPLTHTGTYQVTVGSRTPGRTGRYRLWWRAVNSDSGVNAFTYRGEFSPMPNARDEGDVLGRMWIEAAPAIEAEAVALQGERGERAPEVAEYLVQAGIVYGQLERWADAESAYAEALSILRAMPNPDPQYLEWAVDGLALTAYQRGDWERAIALHQESLALKRRSLENLVPQGSDEVFVAQRAIAATLLQLADIYQRQQRYDEADPLIAEMVALANGFSDPLERAPFQDAASAFYRAQGRESEAVAVVLAPPAAQRTATDGGMAEHPMNLDRLALVAQTQGRYEEAEQLYRQAIAAAERLSGLDPFAVGIFYNLAGLYQAQGQIPVAIETLAAGIALEQRQFDRSLATLSEAGRQRYATSVANTLNHAVSLHLQTAPDSLEAAQLVVTTLLRRKGRVLEAGITSLELLERNPNPEDQRLLNELYRLRQQAAELSFGEVAPPQAQLHSLRSQMEAIEANLARRSAALAEETPPVALADVQSRIPERGALVEYVRYRPFDPVNPLGGGLEGTPTTQAARGFGAPRYAAYVLLSSGELRWADLGDAATIDSQIQRYLELLRCGEQQATPCYEPERLKPVSQELYQAILGSIQSHLREVTHLLISPDSQLNLVPFAALVDRQNRYLIETYMLTHLTSGRDLLRWQSSAPSQQPPVLLADPDFDTADTTGVTEVVSASRGGAHSADMANLRFGRLVGSAQEVAAVGPLLGDDVVVLTQAQATENALKQVQGPSVLHLATHGFFLEDVSVPVVDLAAGEVSQATLPVENPLLRSGLALAGFNQRDSDGEDGVLTALEVAGLNLRGTRLVVLSACETGLGDVADGEGVYGLRRAFVMAGTESQLMSLWQVGDRRTADLMQQYYERLRQGEGRSEALRQVQLAALNSSTYRHPYHWAAFFFSGQWMPMDRL